MERSSGVFPGTPSCGLNKSDDRLSTGQAVHGQRKVSNFHPENTVMVNSLDPEYRIKQDILNLLDDREDMLTPESVTHSAAPGKENTLRNRETTDVASMAGLPPYTATDPCQVAQCTQSHSFMPPETSRIRPQNFAAPYGQRVKNDFTPFWNQWQVSNDTPEAAAGNLSTPSKLSGDNAETALVHSMADLSLKAQSGPGSSTDFSPQGAVACPDLAKFQEPESPYPLSLDASISVSSTNEVEPVNAHLMSLESDLFTAQYSTDSLKQRINHCHSLENYANSLTKESSEWTKAWQDALNFALKFSKVDYHFNLNVAKALISLNNIDKAKLLLFDQLTKFDDQRFLYGVRKLLGFVFFKERKYVDSIKLYMRVFFSTNNVPDENYSHICTSMQYMLKECNDQPFVIEAINWFNGLKPKSGKMTIDPSGFMSPCTASSTSCSETTENTKKFLTSDQVSNAIFGWRKLAALAKTKKPGDPSWYSIWENALGLAVEYAKVDYHFNVNVAIALTRLNLLDQATDILHQQLRRPELASDPQFRRAVNRQLAFVYFRKRDYPGCIYHYMSCYRGTNSKAVSDNSFQYITTAIQVCCTKKDLQPEFLRSALNWYHQLFPQSLADQCLLETQQKPPVADGFCVDEVGWQ